MFKVKICGVTSVGDALIAIEAGADAIGLNFFAASPRCVPLRMAEQIVEAVHAANERAKCVGVFVNYSAEQILRVEEAVGLDAVQLHGDESPALMNALPSQPVIRAVRVADEFDPLSEKVDAWCDEVGRPHAFLCDAPAGKAYGGTGKKVRWDLAARLVEYSTRAILLAGGLNPANVVAAIGSVRPYGVDTASGVESEPGKKDADLVQDFVHKALAALG